MNTKGLSNQEVFDKLLEMIENGETVTYGPVSRFSTKQNERFCQLSCRQILSPHIQFFVVIR